MEELLYNKKRKGGAYGWVGFFRHGEFKSNYIKKAGMHDPRLQTNYFATPEIYPWRVAPQQSPFPFHLIKQKYKCFNTLVKTTKIITNYFVHNSLICNSDLKICNLSEKKLER